MTLREEAESVGMFRSHCPLHQEIGSCALELWPMERWAPALGVREMEEVLGDRRDNCQRWIAPP